MDAKTKEALEGSIEKWLKIVTWTGGDDSCDNCPLCWLFHDDDCDGCPVSNSTGLMYCSGSPYAIWRGAINNTEQDDPPRNVYVATPDMQLAAEGELLFLISLLPERDRNKWYRRTA